MKNLIRPIIAAGLCTIAATSWAADGGRLPDSLKFTFNDLGGVRSWKAGSDTVVFVKSRTEQWYKAEMAETCMALDTKKGITFIVETDPVTNAKTNAVVVDRHICHVTSLTRVDASAVPAK